MLRENLNPPCPLQPRDICPINCPTHKLMTSAFKEFFEITGISSDQMTRQLNTLLARHPEKYFAILEKINETRNARIQIECLRENNNHA